MKIKTMMMTLMMCFLVNVSFGQIERVDTFISVNLVTSTQDVYLDLDGDGNDDLQFDNYGNTHNRYTKVYSVNGDVEMVVDTTKVIAGSSVYSYLRLGVCRNNNNYQNIQGLYLTNWYHQSVSGQYDAKITQAQTLNTGNNLIPFKLWAYNPISSNFEYKLVVLKIFKSSIRTNYIITGWYINHTYNQPLSCNLAYNDSIIASYNIPVPVELISFKADTINGNVQLEWTTATEENNAGFEIERSFDGSNFEKIGFVEGNGTTYEYSNYIFLDEGIKQDVMYYRLKQIDYDGQFEYSNVVVITYSDNNTVSKIYPNPADEVLYLHNLTGMVNIYNLMGQLVLTDDNSDILRNIDISSLVPGIYYVRSENNTYKLLVY